MVYQFNFLTNNLVFIAWEKHPTIEQALQFLQDFEVLLNEANQPLYFISDLRRGYIQNTGLIRRLSALNQHPNYAGGTGFADDILSNSLLRLWKQFSRDEDPVSQVWPRAKDAVEYLESLQPGLTHGVEWRTVLH